MTVYLFFWRLYRRFFIGVFLLSCVVSLLEGVSVAALFPVLYLLLGGAPAEQAAAPLRLLLAVSRAIPVRDPVVAAAVLLLAATALKVAFQLARDACMAAAGGTVQYDLKNRLMQKYAASGYAFFLDRKQGDLLYQLTTAASRVGILCLKIPQFLAETLRTLSVGLLLLWVLPRVTLLLVIVGLGYHALTHLLARNISYHTGQGRVIAGAEQTSTAQEFLSGIRQLMTFGAFPLWLDRFAEAGRRFRTFFIRDSVWLSVPKGLLELTAVFLLGGGVLAVRLSRPEGLQAELPVMGMFALGLMKIFPSLTLLGQLRMEISALSADAQAIHQELIRPIPSQGGRPLGIPALAREIRFQGVSFRHAGGPPLFQGLDLQFERGKVSAVVGSSGSGKSTLVHLLLGFFKPEAGRILIDGADLTGLDLRAWRGRIGFVSQEIFVFHDTVAENIRFGRAGVSAAQIRRAAEVANAHAFIEALPQKYETLVGERGMKLSGGQQQRLCIARAVLHDPEILIFDEATSSLDSESERLIQQALERISKDRTVILIAHRLSTVRKADRIVVLESGRVVEEGNHSDLIRGEGRYFQLVGGAPRKE